MGEQRPGYVRASCRLLVRLKLKKIELCYWLARSVRQRKWHITNSFKKKKKNLFGTGKNLGFIDSSCVMQLVILPDKTD